MILNKQKKVRLATRPLQEFLRKTQRELNIANSEITVAFVSDADIARWNEAYRNKKGPTDVLSFPATAGAAHATLARQSPAQRRGIAKNRGRKIPGDLAASRIVSPPPPGAHPYSPLVHPDAGRTTRLPRLCRGRSFTPVLSGPLFLGDIAIAPETAQRYAKKNGRSLQTEIRVLMLHGLLHLMGYDHESDAGQMNRIEQRLRRRLGIA